MTLALLPLPPAGQVSPVGSDYSVGFNGDFCAIFNYDASKVQTRVIFPGNAQQNQSTGEAIHNIGPTTLLQPATEAEIQALFQAHNIDKEELNEWFGPNTRYYITTTLAVIGGVTVVCAAAYSIRNPEAAKKHVYTAFNYVKSTAAHYLGKMFA